VAVLAKWFLKLAVAAVVSAAASASCAVVVTITPSNMQGWSIEANREASAAICNYGPSLYETEVPWTAEYGEPLGRGAFYAACTYVGQSATNPDDDTPSTAWLGTDTWNGQSLADITLNRITALRYYAYVAGIPCQAGTGDPWNRWISWKYPRQPISLQLTCVSPDGTQRRQFWYMPWHPTKVRGDNSGADGANLKVFKLYDCMDTQVYRCVTRWYCAETEEIFTSWSDFMAAYGSWKLAPTSTEPYPAGYKSPGWDDTTDPPGSPTCTATGKCINFEIGARKGWDAIFGEEAPVCWANDTKGFRGHIDYFTLGIDGVDVTYDFEPDPGTPAPRVVAHSCKAATDPIIQIDMNLRPNDAQNSQVHMVYGRVVNRTNDFFEIDDGSNLKGVGWDGLPIYRPIRVHLPYEHNAQYGQYYAVWGLIEKLRFNGVPWAGDIGYPPYFIWTNWSHCVRLD